MAKRSRSTKPKAAAADMRAEERAREIRTKRREVQHARAMNAETRRLAAAYRSLDVNRLDAARALVAGSGWEVVDGRQLDQLAARERRDAEELRTLREKVASPTFGDDYVKS